MYKQSINGAEALKVGTVDDKARKSEEVSAKQNSKVDSVELSDSAVELSKEEDTETGLKEILVQISGKSEHLPTQR